MPQKTVNLYLAEGVEGQKATPDQSIYTPINPVADELGVTVGRFVFATGTASDPVLDVVSNKTSDQTSVVGFVERVIDYYNYDLTSAATMLLPEDTPLTVAVKGDYWAKSATVAKAGEKVWALKADGSIKTGEDPTSAVDTGWTVKKGGQIGEPIIISNWK